MHQAFLLLARINTTITQYQPLNFSCTSKQRYNYLNFSKKKGVQFKCIDTRVDIRANT